MKTTIHRLAIRALPLFVVLVACLTAAAQDNPACLVVWQKNGQKVRFELAQQPETSFGNGVLTIKTNTSTVAYQLTDILRYTYENVKETGVETMPADKSIKINERGDEVTFRNLKAGTVICLYDLRGVLIDKRKAEGLNPLTISIANRPSGVYIVKTGEETIKLLKP